MIISFNPNVFHTEDVEILQQLSQIFNLIVLKRELIDLVDVDSFLSIIMDDDGKYIFNETHFSKSGLSKIDSKNIEEYFLVWLNKYPYITRTHQKYLTPLHIGLEESEIHPQLALKILSNPEMVQ